MTKYTMHVTDYTNARFMMDHKIIKEITCVEKEAAVNAFKAWCEAIINNMASCRLQVKIHRIAEIDFDDGENEFTVLIFGMRNMEVVCTYGVYLKVIKEIEP